MSIGFDCGTYNLVSSKRGKENKIECKREVNAFLEFPLDNRMVFNMMEKAGVPLIEREDVAYALGESAVDMAYAMPQIDLKRPMKDGCVNPNEVHAFEILSIMIQSLIDCAEDDETLYFSVPAEAINEETDASYHEKILKAIFDVYQSEDGKKVNAQPINEALALIYAELGSTAYTGIGISFGAGMVNLCFAIFGAPVFSFALVNSGDWIDKMAAKATGESATFINREKTKVDLTKDPKNLVERAIQTQYRIMIEKTVNGIKEGFADAGKKARIEKPINVVIAGGTSSPKGFDKLFTDVIMQAKLPMEIGNVVRPKDPLYSVARGCLMAAEEASKSKIK
jgi:actin-like ATPase involved in cell morphogenesis